jgi:hypothetical protein
MSTSPIRLLPSPVPVTFDEIIAAIDQFNRAGRNPFGPNVPVALHSPLLFHLEGPGIGVEFEFNAADRDAETLAFLQKQRGFQTRHAIIYPMTRAMIARQWHRVYAYDVTARTVVDVKLLVARKDDPGLFAKYPRPSAFPWIFALRDSKEPVAFGESIE